MLMATRNYAYIGKCWTAKPDRFKLLAGFWRPAAMTSPCSMDLRDRAIARVVAALSVRAATVLG